jgi:hypothetical protein
MGHFPSGSSFKSVNHFKQLMLAKQFQKYDYGIEDNLIKYKSFKPPCLDLTKIS